MLVCTLVAIACTIAIFLGVGLFPTLMIGTLVVLVYVAIRIRRRYNNTGNTSCIGECIESVLDACDGD